jgi:hypothetical protein
MSNERTCAIGRELILPSGKLHRDEERAGVYAAVTRVEAGHQPLREVELPGFRRRLDDGLRGPPDHRHAVCIGGRFLRDDWLDRVNGHRQHASAGRRREATRIVRRLRRDDAYKENGGGNQEPQSAPPWRNKSAVCRRVAGRTYSNSGERHSKLRGRSAGHFGQAALAMRLGRAALTACVNRA